MNIVAGKQVGPIYYLVKDTAVLQLIVKQGAIRTSVKAEPQSKGGNKYHYVSFMRDLTKADRNPNRWIYGVQLDGDKLSDRYKINPFSYAANSMDSTNSFFRIKSLTAYDDDTYKLSLANWPVMWIPKKVFDDLEALILSDPDGDNEKEHLKISEGRRRYMGKLVTIKYEYGSPHGGFRLTSDRLPASFLSYLLKHTNMNETEERIWILLSMSQMKKNV